MKYCSACLSWKSSAERITTLSCVSSQFHNFSCLVCSLWVTRPILPPNGLYYTFPEMSALHSYHKFLSSVLIRHSLVYTYSVGFLSLCMPTPLSRALTIPARSIIFSQFWNLWLLNSFLWKGPPRFSLHLLV